MKINIFLISVILLGLFQMNNYANKKHKEKVDSFKIIFWLDEAESINKDSIKELYKFSYRDILKKDYYFILTSKHVKKYYWDEQFLIVDKRALVEDGFHPAYGGYFTVVINEKIIYHGHTHTLELANIYPKDKSPYPAIQIDTNRNEVTFFILKPRFLDLNMTFKDYDEKEKAKILNDDIFKYFEKQGVCQVFCVNSFFFLQISTQSILKKDA